MPSAGAQWVRMNGEISFVVSREQAEADPVTVKLVEGASAPLVLKGGGLGKDGSVEDVKARLVVNEYRDALPAEAEGERGKKLLELEVEADVPLSIRSIELQTVDGLPLATPEDWGLYFFHHDPQRWYQQNPQGSRQAFQGYRHGQGTAPQTGQAPRPPEEVQQAQASAWQGGSGG